FGKFSQRLGAIRQEFEKQQIDLSERIKRYYELLNDIKSVGDKAKELNMSLREYGLFVVSQEFVNFDDKNILMDLARDIDSKLSSILDKGRQESSKREEFLKHVKQALQEIILKNYKEKVVVNDFSKYLNRLTDLVIKRF